MENLDEKTSCCTYEADTFHLDFTGHLTLSVLGNEMLNCADAHSESRGFGIAELNENHYTWVLSRLAIEMKRMPRQYERYKIITWVENVYRLFTDRNFEVVAESGEVLGYARSIWAMINVETRKPADLLTLHEGKINDYISDRPCPISRPSRVKVSAPEPVRSLEMRYSDIDINGHVNSVKYIEHILDLFPVDMFQGKHLKRFEIAYIMESYFGDTLSFFSEKTGEDEYDIEIRKNGAEPVCRSKVIFE